MINNVRDLSLTADDIYFLLLGNSRLNVKRPVLEEIIATRRIWK